MSQIDYAKFAKTVLTKEDLEKQAAAEAAGNIKFKNGTYYRFRCVDAVQAVVKHKDKEGNYLPTPSGMKMLRTMWSALRHDGSFATSVKEVQSYFTIYSRPNPDLLEAVGYSKEQIEYATTQGPPNEFFYQSMKGLFAAIWPAQFWAEKNEAGVWNFTKEQVRDAVLAKQDELFADPSILKGSEVLFKTDFKTFNGYTNVNLVWPRNIDMPPKNADGTIPVIESPDKDDQVPF